MTATPKTTVAEENTQRLIARANRLGYIIVMIDTTEKLAIEIRPSTLSLTPRRWLRIGRPASGRFRPPPTAHLTLPRSRRSRTATDAR